MARKHTLRMAAAIFGLALTTACSNPYEPANIDARVVAQEQQDDTRDEVQDLRDAARNRKQER
ncbi:MAG: hypothetical protein V3T74_04235 [Gemmatimonadales bacterium]|jgi:hypothetical protein